MFDLFNELITLISSLRAPPRIHSLFLFTVTLPFQAPNLIPPPGPMLHIFIILTIKTFIWSKMEQPPNPPFLSWISSVSLIMWTLSPHFKTHWRGSSKGFKLLTSNTFWEGGEERRCKESRKCCLQSSHHQPPSPRWGQTQAAERLNITVYKGLSVSVLLTDDLSCFVFLSLVERVMGAEQASWLSWCQHELGLSLHSLSLWWQQRGRHPEV